MIERNNKGQFLKGHNIGEKSLNWKGGKPKCEVCGKIVWYGYTHCHKHPIFKNAEERNRKISEAHKGKKLSDETKKKLSLLRLGKPRMGNPKNWKCSEETKRKISISLKGMKPSAETRKKLSLSKKGIPSNSKGKHHSEEAKQKNRLAHIGKLLGNNNPAWLGGISFDPYPKEFNAELKLKIRTRDNFICCLCGKTEREELEELNRVLCINHIDFNKKNCNSKNLNTLCLRCNIKINREREYWTNYFLNL